MDLENILNIIECKNNVFNIENDQIMEKTFEYKYKISILEKTIYELKIENTKLKNKNNKNKTDLLPNEVITIIMSYLDLKSILECRLTCKYWNNNISHISHKYIKILNKNYKNRSNEYTFLENWKKFMMKKIPFKRILFYDSCNMYNYFIEEMLKNDFSIGDIYYVNVNSNSGLYTNGITMNKYLYVFGDIDVYDNIEYFKPNKIIISETSINKFNFRKIIEYCIKQNRDMFVELDNCITFSFFKHCLKLYNSHVPFIYKVSIDKYEIIKKNDENIINIEINNFCLKKDGNGEYPTFIIKFTIYLSNEFKYTYKEKEEIIKFFKK